MDTENLTQSAKAQKRENAKERNGLLEVFESENAVNCLLDFFSLLRLCVRSFW